MAERGGNEVAGMASASGRISIALSPGLAALLAAAVGAGVWQLHDQVSRGLLITGAVLAFAGLFALFGFMGGLIRFDRRTRRGHFLMASPMPSAMPRGDGWKIARGLRQCPVPELAAAAGVNRLRASTALCGAAAFVEPSISWRGGP